MAAQLERQLKAAQKFLLGAQSLPNYLDIRRKQLTELQRFLGKANALPTDASGRLLEELNAELWGDDTNQLRSSIAQLTAQDDSNKDRSKNQNYLACVHYLSVDLVAQLESNRNRMQVLEQVCSHLLKLGLRHPTEKTIGLILALSFDFHGVAFECDKWQYTQLHKGTIQRLLNKLDPSVYCEELPTDPQQCPRDLFLSAFPEGSQPCAVANPADMILRGRSWPMRTSHRIAGKASVPQAASSKPDFFAVGQMVAGIMSAGQPASSARATTERSMLAVSQNVKTPQLAIEDGSVEEKIERRSDCHEAMTVEPAAEHPSGEAGVAATLAALKHDVLVDSPEAQIQAPLKRPAARKGLEKPASSKVKHAKPKQGLKRPAANMPSTDEIPEDTFSLSLPRVPPPSLLPHGWCSSGRIEAASVFPLQS